MMCCVQQCLPRERDKVLPFWGVGALPVLKKRGNEKGNMPSDLGEKMDMQTCV